MTLYAKIQQDWNEHFTGYSALAIIVSTMIGSVAVMMILSQGVGLWQLFQLFLCVSVCMAHNASILTVQKPKVVLDLLIASVVLNSTLVLLNSL